LELNQTAHLGVEIGGKMCGEKESVKMGLAQKVAKRETFHGLIDGLIEIFITRLEYHRGVWHF